MCMSLSEIILYIQFIKILHHILLYILSISLVYMIVYFSEFVHQHFCMYTHSSVHVHFCQAWLSLLCSFFNDASREADSRRVERTVFDVSDYDITDVQPRRVEEWGSMLSVFTSQWHIIQKRKEGEIDRERDRD